MPRAVLILAAALTTVACATAIRLTPVAPGSPADPDTPEPPAPPMSQTLRTNRSPESREVPAAVLEGSEPGETTHAEHTKEESMPGAVVYTCPMHPEVRNDVPGMCPKCGMKLVPVKPSPDPGSPK